MTPLPDVADSPAATATDGPLRASDADRLATVAELQDAVARGLLTPDEGGDRLAEAYAARYRHDLPPLTADLPKEPVAPAAPGWGPLAALVMAQVRAGAAELRAGGFRSRRTLVAGIVALTLLALLVAVIVGAFAGGSPGPGHGHGGF